MNLFELTRALVDIESVTNHEKQVGDFLFSHLSVLAARSGGRVERIAVEAERDNIFAFWGDAHRHALHAHGHRAAVFSIARRR